MKNLMKKMFVVITTFIYIGSNILFPNLSVLADDLDYYDIIDWPEVRLLNAPPKIVHR